MPEVIFECTNQHCDAYKTGTIVQMKMEDVDDVRLTCELCAEPLEMVTPVLSVGAGWEEKE